LGRVRDKWFPFLEKSKGNGMVDPGNLDQYREKFDRHFGGGK